MLVWTAHATNHQKWRHFYLVQEKSTYALIEMWWKGGEATKVMTIKLELGERGGACAINDDI